jgi:hypothetical protein
MELSLEELYLIKVSIEWAAADQGQTDEITMRLIAKVDDAISLASPTAVSEYDQRP